MAARVMLSGPMAAATAEAHQKKLQKNPLDAGVDLYPVKIRETNPPVIVGELPAEPELDILALNDHRNIVYVHTGVHWTPCPQTIGWVTERSSTIEKLNGGRVIQGIIDAGYTGELIVRVEATTNELDDVISGIEMCIAERLAIAQMIAMGFFYAGLEMVTEGNIIVPLNGRGANGFGSTDRK